MSSYAIIILIITNLVASSMSEDREVKSSQCPSMVGMVEKVDAIWSRVLSPNYISILKWGGGAVNMMWRR